MVFISKSYTRIIYISTIKKRRTFFRTCFNIFPFKIAHKNICESAKTKWRVRDGTTVSSHFRKYKIYIFSPLFYRRYVDDTFVAFRDKNHASLFLDFENQQHPNISFTMECESDNKHAFLDALVCRNATGFDVSVHRKSTFSGLGISFFSYCAHKFKS